jgi:hypothetical protein
LVGVQDENLADLGFHPVDQIVDVPKEAFGLWRFGVRRWNETPFL